MAEDEMWRPGADVGPEDAREHDSSQPATVLLDEVGTTPAKPFQERISPDRATKSRWRRGATIAVVLACVAAAGIVLTVRNGANDRFDRSVVAPDAIESDDRTETASTARFAGSNPQRLPDTVAQRWSVVLAGIEGSRDAAMLVDGRDLAIGVFRNAATSDTATPAATFVALDATTGEERWRTPIASDVSAFTLLGAIDGVVVAERLDTDNRSVIGLSAATGEIVWERSTGDPGVHVVLEGTSVVTRVSFTVNARLTFIDPASGSEVGRVPGRLFATDFLGRWYVRNGSSVSAIDLSDGFQPPVEIATLANGDDRAATVVDGRVLSADGGVISLRTDAGMSIPLSIGTPPEVTLPDRIRRFSPMVGSTFAFAGSGMVVGAELRDEIITATWQIDGGVVATTTNDRGLMLLVGAEGDPMQRLVDGSTGETIVSVEVGDEPVLAGNGVIVRRNADIGVERVGLDLDGNERWSLLGDGPVAIGHRLLVTYGPADGGVNVIGFGDEN